MADISGQQWTEEDYKNLFEAKKDGKSYEEISKILGRSVKAIELRERLNVYLMQRDGKTMNEIKEVTGLSDADIFKHIKIEYSARCKKYFHPKASNSNKVDQIEIHDILDDITKSV